MMAITFKEDSLTKTMSVLATAKHMTFVEISKPPMDGIMKEITKTRHMIINLQGMGSSGLFT